MRFAVFAFGTLGAALFVGLVVSAGWREVLGAATTAGWGFAAVLAWRMVALGADAEAWCLLLGPAGSGRRLMAVRLRWIADSVNSLLPAAFVGGELLRVRLAILAGMSGTLAGASVLVDVTLAVICQIIFSIMGVVALLAIGVDGGDGIATSVLVGVLLFALMVVPVVLVQSGGLFRYIAKLLPRLLPKRDWSTVLGGAAALDRTVLDIYARRRRLIWSTVWRLMGWVTGAGEIWLILHFLGHPVGVLEALMLESLIQAVRSAAFAVPGALGVQEGAFVLLCGLVGIDAGTALALSLVRRARELSIGLPGLYAWHHAEAGARRRRRMAEASSPTPP